MEIKTSTIVNTEDKSSHNIFQVENYILAFNLDTNKIYNFKDKQIYLQVDIKDFNISVYKLDDNYDITELISLLTHLIENYCINDYVDITGEINDYITFNKIVYKKLFSIFLPHIPTINCNNKNVSSDTELIKYKDKYLGFLNNNEVIPVIIILLIIKNYVTNNGLFIIPFNIYYNVYETVNSDETTENISNHIIMKDRYKLSNNSYLNKGDHIFNIDGREFNNMGFIYCPEINSSLHINTYLLLFGSSNITVTYASELTVSKFKNIKTEVCKVPIKEVCKVPIKEVKLNIDKFISDNLKVPIKQQEIFTFRDKQFQIMSEELLDEIDINNHPIDINRYNNYYSSNKIIVMKDDKDEKLYVLNKISGKLILNNKTFEEIISKIKSKNKRKFEFVRDDLECSHIVYI